MILPTLCLVQKCDSGTSRWLALFTPYSKESDLLKKKKTMQPCVPALSQVCVWLLPELCTATTAQWHNDSSEHSSDLCDWIALSEMNKEGLFHGTSPSGLLLPYLHIPPPLVTTTGQLGHEGKWFWCISGLFFWKREYLWLWGAGA